MIQFAVDFGAVDQAKAELGIEETVWIAIEPVEVDSWGWYSCDNDKGHHLIVLNSLRRRSARQMSKTLWHELRHAQQAERVGLEHFHRWSNNNGERCELEARQTEANHDRLPLVVRLDV